MANQSSVNQMSELVSQMTRAIRNPRNHEQMPAIVSQIINVYKDSDLLQDNKRFKTRFFNRLVMYMNDIKESNSIQEETKQQQLTNILEAICELYYQGYQGEPFDVPLYRFLYNNQVIWIYQFAPQNIRNIYSEVNTYDWTFDEAPNQTIADKINEDILRHIDQFRAEINMDQFNGGMRRRKRRVAKRRTTKRRATKRRSTKRRVTKRRQQTKRRR